ncbi:MAG: SOS response-associated peptidase [Marinicaulis sp.]|nr:SOS response-associated peptidase [Marinicaulis sp.]
MCGRYHLNSTPSEVGNMFDVDIRDNFPPRYNVAPSQPIASIRMSDAGKREYALMRWGFIPSWAKKDYHERMGSKPLINARGETVAEKPTFRSAFKRRRCLIPADGFYEWKAGADGKQPFRISRGGLFGFAGIWETATDPDGGEIDTAAIITIAAGQDVKGLHHREPVVIEPEHFDDWLTADERDTEMFSDLIAPAAKGTWEHYPVTKKVGSPRNDGPDLIEEISL